MFVCCNVFSGQAVKAACKDPDLKPLQLSTGPRKQLTGTAKCEVLVDPGLRALLRTAKCRAQQLSSEDVRFSMFIAKIVGSPSSSRLLASQNDLAGALVTPLSMIQWMKLRSET